MMLFEWSLLCWVLELEWSFGWVLATFLATRVALWTPVPGGLGVLEASVVGVAVMVGAGIPDALALCALSRMRDAFILGGSLVSSVPELSAFKRQTT